ncbi:hypothetical protein A5875_003926 [Enterococcus sp. 3H8_DIV0648]|nr:hypothetical protein A5875_003926 [Enterococcus sp. 3H8_DIV0648]
MLIMGFCFVSILFSTIVISLLTFMVNPKLELFPQLLELGDVINTFPTIITISIMTACLSLIPLYFGMKKKSSSTTITWGVIIGLLVNATVSDGAATVNMVQLLVIPGILALVGLTIVYFTFRNIESQDIL